MHSLRYSILALCLLAAIAWFNRPSLSSDPLQSLRPSPRVTALQHQLSSSARNNTLWIVIRQSQHTQNSENSDLHTITQQFADSLKASPEHAQNITIHGPSDMLLNDLAELTSYSWHIAPPSQQKALVQRLTQPQARENTIQQTLQSLQYASPGPELSLLSHDPLQLRQSPALIQHQSSPSQSHQNLPSFAPNPTPKISQIRLQYPSQSAAEAHIPALQNALQQHFPASQYRSAITGEAAFAREIAASMKRDIRTSVTTTVLGLLLLFLLLISRRWQPSHLLILLPPLAAVISAWFIAGLAFQPLHILGASCSALLLSLVIDYAIIARTETLHHQRRFPASNGILWSALSTALVFGSLHFSQVPGLQQFGILIATGILAAAALVIGPLWSHWQNKTPSQPSQLAAPKKQLPWHSIWRISRPIVLLLSLASIPILLLNGLPQLSPHTSLAPKNSPASWALQTLQSQQSQPPHSYLLRAQNPQQLKQHITQARAQHPSIQNNPSHWLPAETPPPQTAPTTHPFQTLAPHQSAILQSLAKVGFTPQSSTFSAQVLQNLHTPPTTPNQTKQTKQTKQTAPATAPIPQLLRNQLLHTPAGPAAILHSPTPLDTQHSQPTLIPLGWDTLSQELLQQLQNFARHTLLYISLALTLILYLALRSMRQSLHAILQLSAISLLTLAAHSLLHIHISAFSLAIIPLLLGIALDYQIHLRLAARRHQTDPQALPRTTHALFFCCTSTLVGFASLSIASNPALQQLGQSGTIGIAAIGLISLLTPRQQPD